MAVIYNLEFTRVDMEMSIYVNGRLRAAKFADHQLKVNCRFQFYVETGNPIHLTIVLFGNSQLHKSKTPGGFGVSFTLYRTGAKRPVAMVRDSWDHSGLDQAKIQEYSYVLR